MDAEPDSREMAKAHRLINAQLFDRLRAQRRMAAQDIQALARELGVY